MPPIQKALGLVGLSKQASKGTPDTQPDFVYGISSGGMFKADVSQDDEHVTLDAARIAVDSNRMSVVPGQAYKTRLYPKSAGLLLYAALGAIAHSGSGPYTHTITPATDVPYLTGWGKTGGVLYRVQDAKMDELDIAWKGAGPLEASVALVGTVIGFPGSITPGVDDSQSPYFRAAGGTFALDAGSDTPATAPVSAGSIKIANGVAPVLLSESVVPNDVSVAAQMLTVSLTLVVNSLAEWRKILTGTDSGTAVSEVAVKGSFAHHFEIDADNTLDLEADNCAFTCDFPDADPKGGPTELELKGSILIASPALTATLVNATATY